MHVIFTSAENVICGLIILNSGKRAIYFVSRTHMAGKYSIQVLSLGPNSWTGLLYLVHGTFIITVAPFRTTLATGKES